MNDFLFESLLVALAAAYLVYRVVRYLARSRQERLRAQGYRLIHALNAYSAWVDCQRDEPFLAHSIDELSSPEPLTQARRVKEESFPTLSQHMVRLLQAHSRLIEYLWQQNLLRMGQAAGWRPAHQDAQYQQIRGAQEDLIQEMVALCREMIGESQREWRRTGTDFAFSNSVGISTTQGPASGN